MTNAQIINTKHSIIRKMCYERTVSYISAARAIIHLENEKIEDDPTILKSIWHILDLISCEIHTLNNTLDIEMTKTLKETEPEQRQLK